MEERNFCCQLKEKKMSQLCSQPPEALEVSGRGGFFIAGYRGCQQLNN
jgi:hypothetical protein